MLLNHARFYAVFFSCLFWFFWGKMVTWFAHLSGESTSFIRPLYFLFLGLQFPPKFMYRFEVLFCYYYYCFCLITLIFQLKKEGKKGELNEELNFEVSSCILDSNPT